MLSIYARRAGSLNAVKDVIGYLLEEIVAADRMSMEINPHKVNPHFSSLFSVEQRLIMRAFAGRFIWI